MYVDDATFNPAADPAGPIRPLSDDEVAAFVDDLNRNNDGVISFAEVEAKLDEVARELKPDTNMSQQDDDEASARHRFLRALLGPEDEIPVDEFAARVKSWRIPSLQQETEADSEQDSYLRNMSYGRRLQSYWAVHGPHVLFLSLVVAMELAFGIWQLVKYLGPAYSGALGWGVVLAKTCAGMLYPTLFFLLLSMARYLSTTLRLSYAVSRFVNFDLSQSFHIYLAIWATFLGSLHGIAHLTGDFVWIANSYRPQPLRALLGPAADWSYRDLVSSRPGITGILSLFFFYTIGMASVPWVRRRNYELFQATHLLMYPIIGCLMAHGTSAILQFPMLGYFLAFPTLLVLTERVTRLVRGFRPINATIRVLDAETVSIRAEIPQSRYFPYQAGHYLFLQVPALSRWQWHPFTISTCLDREIQLHIKTDGNWTKRLRELAEPKLAGGEKPQEGTGKPVPITIGVDGPFGAPAQRFYDFSHTILVGSGIGVTPFAGILADLQHREDEERGGPDVASRRGSSISASDTDVPGRLSRSQSRRASFRRPSFARRRSSSRQRNATPKEFPSDYRRVDMHWVARSRTHLSWFSDLLNSVQRSQDYHKTLAQSDGKAHAHLDIRIRTHVSMKRKDLSTHIYRWLLELHRTPEHPNSLLTGLVNPTHFGRPDFEAILNEHYEDMRRYQQQFGHKSEGGYDMNGDGSRDRFKVGVFFCGAPVVGEILADRCRALTARGREEGSCIEYYFMMEVFG